MSPGRKFFAGRYERAEWNASKLEYVTAGGSRSIDGDVWTDKTGVKLLTTVYFHDLAIHLAGGPRDGEVVS